MNPAIFEEFDRLLSTKRVGGRVLEIGAVPTSHSLLNLQALDGADEYVGLNLDGGASYKSGGKDPRREFKIIKGNSNAMGCFPDGHFDTILSNSVLEHDAFFWKSLAEIRRVACDGALIAIGAPGYDQMENSRLLIERDEAAWKLFSEVGERLYGTLTLSVHNWPGDYYRFSPQAFREVIFSGMAEVEVYSVMIPPRIIGAGYVAKERP